MAKKQNTKKQSHFETKGKKAAAQPQKPAFELSLDTVGWWIYLLGVAMVPASYFFNKIVTEYYWIKAVWGVALMPAAVLIAFYVAWQRGTFILRSSRVVLPYLIFVAVAVLSLTWASNVWKGVERMIQISGGFFAFVGGLHYLNSRSRLWQLFAVGITVALGVTFYGLMQYSEIFYLPRDQYKNPDPSTTIGLTNFVVEYLISMMPLFLFGVFVIRRDWLRMLWVCATLVIVFYFMISDNRNGYLSLIGGGGTVLALTAYTVWKRNEVLRFPKKIFVMVHVVALFLLVGGLVITPIGQKIVDRMSSITEFERDASIRFRIHTWDQCVNNMIPDNFFTGVGFANIEVEFPRYYTEFLEGMTLRHNTRVVRAHNEYVQIMVDMGLLGMIPFLLFLFAIFRTGFDIEKLVRNRRDFFLFASLAGGLVGFMISSFFAFPMQVPTSSMYFFLFVMVFDRFRAILKEEAGEESGDKVIQLQGPAQVGLIVLAVVTFTGQAWATNYTYHALSGEVRNKEARVFKRYKKWEDTLRLMDIAVGHNRNMEGYWYDRSVALMHFKRYEEALKNLEETRRLVPNYGMGRKQIGVLAAQLGKTELAIEEYKATMRIFKKQRPELTKMIADIGLKRNRPDLVLPVLEEGFGLGFTAPIYRKTYANALALDKQYEKAIGEYEILLQDHKNITPDVLGNYATALMATKQYERARPVFNKVTKAQPRNERNWYNFARLHAQVGEQEEALATLQKAFTIKPALRRQALQDPVFKDEFYRSALKP